jgi:transglutaminase-like putative cysteine protease/predicted glutamine amidotransferase
MPNLFAMSFEGMLAPSFDLRCLEKGRGLLPDGWGIGYYPAGEPSAPVLKEPAPTHGSLRGELVKAWDHLESSLFLLHIRAATWGQNTLANTQPFARSLAGRDWLIAHSGSLRERFELSATGLDMVATPRFEPVGATDTELIFCELLNRAADLGYRSIGDIPADTLCAWLAELNEHGSLNTVLTDGHDLVVYADRRGDGAMHIWQLLPPYGEIIVGDDDLTIDLTRRGIKGRKGVLVSSSPLLPHTDFTARWEEVPPGEMLVIRQGAIRSRVRAGKSDAASKISTLGIKVMRPAVAEPRTYNVTHRTTYTYDKPIERSSHVFRLTPMIDRQQALLAHKVEVSVDGVEREYEDVFGNRVRGLLIETPFTELSIVGRSRVYVSDTDPLVSYGAVHSRHALPMVWMPWQRQILQPYLLPTELPHTQLAELTEYAMSFVERNDYDLVDTLLDLNRTIFTEYEYVQGVTTVHTTAFDTYGKRRGVCQDFAELLITLARLLSVPARYVCGYVHPGGAVQNVEQAQASHAWVQVYLPEVGWRGLDPTNGVVTQTEHIRVAVGRNYVDTTPTSGTIYVGGGDETLVVDVRVETVPNDPPRESGRLPSTG